jgi:hypothetical protein
MRQSTAHQFIDFNHDPFGSTLVVPADDASRVTSQAIALPQHDVEALCQADYYLETIGYHFDTVVALSSIDTIEPDYSTTAAIAALFG